MRLVLSISAGPAPSHSNEGNKDMDPFRNQWSKTGFYIIESRKTDHIDNDTDSHHSDVSRSTLCFKIKAGALSFEQQYLQ